jgi:uncharacterized protein YjbJ (UPF0337 family)
LQKEIVRPARAANQETKNMSTLVAKGNWNIAKGRFKQKLARLLDDDLQFVEGKTDELIGRIQKRKGQSRKRFERAADDVDECCPGHY